MAQYVEEEAHVMDYQSKPLNMDTKIHETKGSFCIEALLSRTNTTTAGTPEVSRSTSPTSTTSRSPPISPGCEDAVPSSTFIPRPGLLHHMYPGSNPLYAYPQQGSAFHSLVGGGVMQKVHVPANVHGQHQFHQMQLEWFARTGMFYPRLQDLAGRLL